MVCIFVQLLRVHGGIRTGTVNVLKQTTNSMASISSINSQPQGVLFTHTKGIHYSSELTLNN
jgi:hypothetical protein